MSTAMVSNRLVCIRSSNVDCFLEFSNPLHAKYHYYCCIYEYILANSPHRVFLHELHHTFDMRFIRAKVVDGIDVITIPHQGNKIVYREAAGGRLVVDVEFIRNFAIFQYMMDAIPKFARARGDIWSYVDDGITFVCSNKVPAVVVPQQYLDEYKNILETRLYGYDVGCTLCDVDIPMYTEIKRN